MTHAWMNASWQAYDRAVQEDMLLDQRLAEMHQRGLTPGFCRNRIDRSRALVIGCNYARTKAVRLWGAVADARSWADVLVSRLGVPEQNMALLVDEDADGKPLTEVDRAFPSQKNILEHLTWLTNSPEPGDLIVFIFCGRGAMIHTDEEEEGWDDDDSDTEPRDGAGSEEGLLCADFASSDWVRGYSSRLITSSMAASFWQTLPRGAALTLVIDAEHGATLLPVSRRLDSTRLPELGVFAEVQPDAVPEALALGELRPRTSPPLPPPDEDSHPAEPNRGCRGPAGVQARKRWFPSRMLWDVTAGEEDQPGIEQEVQAFALVAAAPGGWAFEGSLEGKRQKPKGPAGRRGIMSQCLLKALEELNYQCSYYALWWNAVRIMRASGCRNQNFHMLFSDGADPVAREAFEPVGAAEARAYARRSLQDKVAEEEEERQCRGASCIQVHDEFHRQPLSARSSAACGCSSPGAHMMDCSIM